MKKASNILRQISASVLTGTYLAFWAWMSLHHFILHDHHQHEQKVCHHAPGEKHLHSEEYAGIDCSLCQIAPSFAEPPILPISAIRLLELVQAKPFFSESPFLSASPHTLAQPRAPPVRAA